MRVTAPRPRRSSCGSPVRVCPSMARAAAERGPDVGEPIRIRRCAGPAGPPAAARGRPRRIRPWSRSTTPRAWRATDSIHGVGRRRQRARSARASAARGSAMASRNSSAGSTASSVGTGAPFPHQALHFTTVEDACAIHQRSGGHHDPHAGRRSPTEDRTTAHSGPAPGHHRTHDADLIVDSETDDPADFNFICDGQHVLRRTTAQPRPSRRYVARGSTAANASTTRRLATLFGDRRHGAPERRPCAGADRRAGRRPHDPGEQRTSWRTLDELDRGWRTRGRRRPTTSCTSAARGDVLPGHRARGDRPDRTLAAR